MRTFRAVLMLATATAVLALAPAAQAAFPGANGRIAFNEPVGGDQEIFSVNPDGSGMLQLTQNDLHDFTPGWSADGSRIVFGRLGQAGASARTSSPGSG